MGNLCCKKRSDENKGLTESRDIEPETIQLNTCPPPKYLETLPISKLSNLLI
jgi:hypothetical protein